MFVRYTIIKQTFGRWIFMQKAAEHKHSLFSLIKENYLSQSKHHPFKVYSQMPSKQITLFIKQAVQKEALITIQLNASTLNTIITEATGFPSFSPYSSQVILTSKDKKTIHLIKAKDIRHIRLKA